MPAFSRFAGAYGAGFIANTWEPRSQNDAGHALERGSTALLSSVGWHIFEEFWPDIRGAFHHHKAVASKGKYRSLKFRSCARMRTCLTIRNDHAQES
jgi:hypothetical protein